MPPLVNPTFLRPTVILLVSSVWLITACQSPQAVFEEETEKQRQIWKEAVSTQSKLDKASITWEEALTSLQTNNVELLKARESIENAKHSIKRVKHTLLPRLYLQSSSNTSITDLDQLSLDQFTFRLYGFLNISGLLKFQPRLFAAKLSAIYTRITYELREREQILELYRLFVEAEQIQTKLEQLAKAQEFLDQNQDASLLSRLDLRKQKNKLETAQDTQANQLSTLIGDHSKLWLPDSQSLPQLDYHIPPDLAQYAANQFGELETKLYALEIIKAQAEIKRISFQRWPDFNLALSGPPIVQNASGETTYWSTEDVRLNAWAFWNFDAQGHIRSQFKSKHRLHAIQLKEIQQTRANSARKLINLLEQLLQLKEENTLLSEELQTPALAPSIQETLKTEKEQLEKQILEYTLLLLFFDNEFTTKIKLPAK